MCFYIGIEDLAANALIEVLHGSTDNHGSDEHRRFLTYSAIESYGAAVVRLLKDKGEKAVLVLSRDNTSIFFHNYSDFFEEREIDGQKGIFLKEDKEADDLIEQFRGYLALDVLKAFMNKNSVKVLGVQHEKI